MEGTLSDHSHRVHHYHNKDYDKYNAKFMGDFVNESFISGLPLDKEVKVIMVTAKSEEYKEEVEVWLKKKNIDWIDEIHYRDPEDKAPSVMVKELYLEALQERFNIIHTYDDREDICMMYRSHNIPCTQVDCRAKPKAHLTVPQLLRESADVFEDRDSTYGSSYKQFGDIVEALFPKGVHLFTKEDMNRYGILTMMVAKMQRYCNNFSECGHRDSLIDLSTYAAMLNEVDDVYYT